MSTIAPPTSTTAACDSSPAREQIRMAALRDYGILDTQREAAFDDITRIAKTICGTSMAIVTLVDTDRQWFKSEIGVGVRETPRDVAFCAHAILQSDLFIVPDTHKDPRFRDNALVTGPPFLRFYAGAVLTTPDGLALGTVCVLDNVPRELTADQGAALQALARQTMAQLELRRAFTLAQAAGKYRSRLMAIAGHDLKTPLRAIAYAIDRSVRDAAPESAARLQSAVKHIHQIDADFSRLVAAASVADEETTPRPEAVSIDAVLAPILETWTSHAARKGIALLHSPCGLHGMTQPLLLSTLLGNLIGNAVKYTRHGEVTVDCAEHGEELVITIQDTGIGMSVNELDHLFEAFNQTDSSSEGLGMGLWIVRRSADALGHALSVSSEPGTGTRFTLRLPKAS